MATREARKSHGILRGFWNWILSFLDERVPTEHTLEGMLNTMIDALDAKADAASMAMALADQTRHNLEAAIAVYEGCAAQALEYAQKGNRGDAQRCLLLKAEAGENVERLTNLLREQQANADYLAAQYADAQNEVSRRRRELPQIKADARVAEAEKKFAEAQGRYNLQAATADFDEARDKIQLERQAARNRVALERDPMAEMRAKVRNDATERRLAEELDELMRQARSTESGEGSEPSSDPLLIEHNPVMEARELLAQPRLTEFAKRKLLP